MFQINLNCRAPVENVMFYVDKVVGGTDSPTISNIGRKTMSAVFLIEQWF